MTTKKSRTCVFGRAIVTFMNTSRLANKKEMQMPTLQRQLSQTNSSVVLTFWATQAPANRSTSPAAWPTKSEIAGAVE